MKPRFPNRQQTSDAPAPGPDEGSSSLPGARLALPGKVAGQQIPPARRRPRIPFADLHSDCPEPHPNSPRLPLQLSLQMVRQVRRVAREANHTFEYTAEVLLRYGLQQRSAAHRLLTCWKQLTQREQLVAWLAWRGDSFGQICQQLHLELRTVRAHLDHAQAKFEARDRRCLLRDLMTLAELNPGVFKDLEDETPQPGRDW